MHHFPVDPVRERSDGRSAASAERDRPVAPCVPAVPAVGGGPVMAHRVHGRFAGVVVLVVLVLSLAMLGYDYLTPPPGDFAVRQGDIDLSVGDYDQALAHFDHALALSPNHRGALMGRAIVFLQTGQLGAAEAGLRFLIDHLRRTVTADDGTGRGTLAAAHANLGILYDRQGRYEAALESYWQALATDAVAVNGPGLWHRIIHDPTPSTVEKRALYLARQLALPEHKRVLRLESADRAQRMHKP